VAQPRLRVLLGLLGVAQGRVVTGEALVDGVWGEEWSPERVFRAVLSEHLEEGWRRLA